MDSPTPGLTPHSLYLGLDAEATQHCQAYRALFRPQLDADAAGDVRRALQLGMPLGSERFAETICTRLGIRRNTGKRGRTPGDEPDSRPARAEQQGFGFREWRKQRCEMKNEMSLTLLVLFRPSARYWCGQAIPALTRNAVIPGLTRNPAFLLWQPGDAMANIRRSCRMQTRMIPLRLAVAGLAVMLLSACASDLIITHKNAPGDQVRLMGQGDSFECNDPAYADVKKVQSATLVFTDGTISLCRSADAVAPRERKEGSAPRAPMAVGTGTASGDGNEGVILGGPQRGGSKKSFGDRGL